LKPAGTVSAPPPPPPAPPIPAPVVLVALVVGAFESFEEQLSANTRSGLTTSQSFDEGEESKRACIVG